MRNFKIGQKLLCVKQAPIYEDEIPHGVKAPIIGNKYTIRNLEIHKGKVYITLNEILNPLIQYKNKLSEVYFNIKYFEIIKDDFAENLCAKLIEEFKEEQKKEYINN